MQTQTTRFGIFHIIIIAILAFAGYLGHQKYQKTQEAKASKESMVKIEAAYADWNESNKIAMSIPRIALATPLAKLQEIKKRVADISATGCAAEAKNKLTNAMDMQINGFIAFLKDESSSASEAMLLATAKFIEYNSLTETCGK